MNDQQAAVLAFEAAHPVWRWAGAKEAAIRDQLGIGATRYYQVLNHLLDDPDAWAAHPALVKRLRRLRDARRAARTARGSG